MSKRREQIKSGLAENLNEIVSLFRSIPPEKLNTRVYQDGARWTARQILAHLITIEKSMHWLFRNILAGGPGSPRDFDIDRFNQTQPAKLDGFSVDDLIDQFTDVRKETMAMVDAMTEDDLDRTGWHAFHGEDTLERFVVWAFEHARLHMDDLHGVLALNETP